MNRDKASTVTQVSFFVGIVIVSLLCIFLFLIFHEFLRVNNDFEEVFANCETKDSILILVVRARFDR